jgi:hypothetical protein
MTYSSFELKYCERCGGLGLRRNHSGLSYCRQCVQMMQKFLLTPRHTPHQPDGRVKLPLKQLLVKPLTGSSSRESSYAV